MKKIWGFTILFLLVMAGLYIGYKVILPSDYHNYNSQKAYQKQKKTLSTMEMICYYTGLEFPEDSKLVSSEYLSDMDECLESTLMVPEKEMDKVVPDSYRIYDLSGLTEREIKESAIDPMDYYYQIYQSVEMKETATQRTITCIIGKPINGWCKVHVSVNCLGMHLCGSKNLGGVDLTLKEK